jgi:hypothetical protein
MASQTQFLFQVKSGTSVSFVAYSWTGQAGQDRTGHASTRQAIRHAHGDRRQVHGWTGMTAQLYDSMLVDYVH